MKLVKEYLSDEAKRTHKWCYENGIALSFEKTKAMLILSNARESRLTGIKQTLTKILTEH